MQIWLAYRIYNGNLIFPQILVALVADASSEVPEGIINLSFI